MYLKLCVLYFNGKLGGTYQGRQDRRTAVKLSSINPARTALVAAMTAVLCASMLAAAPANAQEVTPQTTTAASQEQVHSFNALLDAVDPSTRAFDASQALADGVAVRDVQDFANTWIALAEGAVSGISPQPAEVRTLREILATTTACRGRNTWDKTGLQYNLYFNSCKAGELSRVYGTGAAALGVVTAICGAIGFAPGAAGAGVIGSILGLGAVIVNNCNAKGRGIIIRAVPPAVWCNSQ